MGDTALASPIQSVKWTIACVARTRFRVQKWVPTPSLPTLHHYHTKHGEMPTWETPCTQAACIHASRSLGRGPSPSRSLICKTQIVFSNMDRHNKVRSSRPENCKSLVRVRIRSHVYRRDVLALVIIIVDLYWYRRLQWRVGSSICLAHLLLW